MAERTTVNSLSGGKTSSYLAVHYPADIEIFSLVCIRDHNAAGTLKRDKKLIQKVNDKLHPDGISRYGPFVATAEDPKVLTVMFDLEQKLGREIVWVRGPSWEDMIASRQALPNPFMRFCTTELKILPIFQYLYLYERLPVRMRCGYRYDEKERADTFTTSMKVSLSGKVSTRQHSWQELEWRSGAFPLIEDRISVWEVARYWQDQPLDFPEDSNCLNCFWKPPEQLRKNFETAPAIMAWANVMEAMTDHSFKKDLPLRKVSRMGIQASFRFGTGSGCQAGFCTD